MQQGFRIGEWQGEPDTGTLTRGGERVQLELKAMEVLVYLARHAGKVLSKERLIQAVWANTFVGDGFLPARSSFCVRPSAKTLPTATTSRLYLGAAIA